MDINDLSQIIINIGRELAPVQRLFSGLAYIIGIIFVISALFKFRKISNSRVSSGANDTAFVAFAYLIGGSMLLFLPTAFQALSATVFGVGNVLQYTSINPIDVTSAMIFLVQTAGLIWFVRGCVLLVSASQPGVQEGPKGMVFLIAGILAMNFQATASSVNEILEKIISYTLAIKDQFGF